MDALITRTMTIEEIFKRFPQKGQKLAQEMTQRGLHCVGCSASTWETLEQGMLGHGMEEEEIESLVQSLNQILQEKEDPSTITLTPKAAEKFQEVLESEGKTGWHLRFGEKPAGCSGFEYFLDYSKQAGEDDAIYHSQGVEIHVKKTSESRLKGCIIDYAEGLQGSGFKISNPNVRSSCGCGNSHGY